MKKLLSVVLCLLLALSLLGATAENVVIEAVPNEGQFEGEELTILVSAGWMDNRYGDTIARFEETYGLVRLDMQEKPLCAWETILLGSHAKKEAVQELLRFSMKEARNIVTEYSLETEQTGC